MYQEPGKNTKAVQQDTRLPELLSPALTPFLEQTQGLDVITPPASGVILLPPVYQSLSDIPDALSTKRTMFTGSSRRFRDGKKSPEPHSFMQSQGAVAV